MSLTHSTPISFQRNTADAVIIYMGGAQDSQTITKKLSPRDPQQPWVMMAFETPLYSNSIHKVRYENYNGLFNRTMTYRQDADIMVHHGFIVHRNESHLLPRSWVVPPVMEVINAPRKLAVTFISNCKAKSNRLQYIKRVEKYAQVDVVGECGPLECGDSMYVEHRYDVTTNQCLKIAGKHYLFFFAFENNFCKEYVTEKVYNLLYYPIVPVVRGSANYSALLPPNSYINANNYSPKELAERLLYLKEHPKDPKAALDIRYIDDTFINAANEIEWRHCVEDLKKNQSFISHAKELLIVPQLLDIRLRLNSNGECLDNSIRQ
ncbi:alpha-(1,3)-fucosyltransferase C-like [Macrobrachium nipponense]|uniref:alpha-(1,3)-fucosyltransferase C-like n=1 Tax=Macrobrachium nipponense TaxID=159736 RepID=UPI0030C7CCE8